MKLLITTQILDREDPGLGFFHEWVAGLAAKVESIQVICLKEGRHELPANVTVHSLGKEQGAASRLVYMFRFGQLVWRLRHAHDAVFVHMNQEYILLAGWFWRILGKRIYLWRNHYAGSLLTDVAALFCTKIFCTSRFSYTAKYKKTVRMPVGVDTARFYQDTSVTRKPSSILFLARMSPSKRPDLLVEALGLLISKGVSFVADFYGSPAPGDEVYYASLKARAEALGLHDRVRFYPAVTHEKAVDVFRSHEIFVNCSPSGMFDKTLFEAAACGALVVAASEDFNEALGNTASFTDALTLSEALATVLALSPESRHELEELMGRLAENHSLPRLIDNLVRECTA